MKGHEETVRRKSTQQAISFSNSFSIKPSNFVRLAHTCFGLLFNGWRLILMRQNSQTLLVYYSFVNRAEIRDGSMAFYPSGSRQHLHLQVWDERLPFSFAISIKARCARLQASLSLRRVLEEYAKRLEVSEHALHLLD